MWVWFFFLRSKMYPTIILFWHYNTHLVRKRIASTVKASAPRNGPPKLLHKRSKRRPMRKSFSSSPSVIMYYYSSTLCESLWTRQLLLVLCTMYTPPVSRKKTLSSQNCWLCFKLVEGFDLIYLLSILLPNPLRNLERASQLLHLLNSFLIKVCGSENKLCR